MEANSREVYTRVDGQEWDVTKAFFLTCYGSSSISRASDSYVNETQIERGLTSVVAHPISLLHDNSLENIQSAF